jgi:cell division protease FtsH
MNQFSRNLALWLVLGLMVVLLFNMFQGQQTRDEEVSYSQFVTDLNEGRVAEVTVQGNVIKGTLEGDRPFRSYGPQDDAIKRFLDLGIPFTVKPEAEEPWYMVLLVQWFPMLLLVAVWIFFMRQMQMGGGKAMAFGKSRAKLLNENQNKVTFSDVAGIDEAKDELEEIIAFLRDPKKFTRLGGRIPKGVLLVGSPGTGKTLLARAVAGEAGVPFFSISGSDFVEMFVGVGASRVRDLFVQGKKNAPCIIFIDEIDAVGRHRGAGLGGGHDEREQTLNQLLVEMDGFESNEGVIMVAATNRPDVLDPALLRPGRFDRRIVVPRPDVRGREGILRVHTRKVPLGDDVDIAVLAKATPGFSGADLENLVNEAALEAAREGSDSVCQRNFDQAKDKVLMGSERKSLVLSEEERRNTAYHESGHALVAKMLPGADPVHKVTIIPRGMALGVTQQLPEDDRHTYSRGWLLNNLAILYGGRVAEELVLNEITTGAGNDIEKATELARKMVCEWGMSLDLGPVMLAKPSDEVFLGMDIHQRREYSEETARSIDSEVRKILSDAYTRAKEILKTNLNVLHSMAEALLEREVLDGKEIDAIMSAHGVSGPGDVAGSPA